MSISYRYGDRWKCKTTAASPGVLVCASSPAPHNLPFIRHGFTFKNWRRACYCSHFPHRQGTWTAHLRSAPRPGPFSFLWLQTCTSDQHLIKHTQVRLKSNLEQISQDGPILWIWPRSIHPPNTHTHTRALSVSNGRGFCFLRGSCCGNVCFMTF